MSRTLDIREIGPEEAAATARAVLAAGGTVAFPTETVYGLAIRANDDRAYQALYRLKGRDAGKPLARYVDSAAAVLRIEGAVSLRAEKLMRAFWPGPLTLVIENARGEKTGYRCSSNAVCALMASDPDLPVLGTSANLSGEPPIETAAGIAAALGEGVDLVLDLGGPLPGLATTVIELPRRGGYRLLRLGELDEAVLASELAALVVFVCSGNTCRSPLAAAMLAEILESRRPAGVAACRLEIRSAGLGAFPGQPASENSRQVASRRGLDLSGHLSAPLDRRLLDRADRIYTMTAAHREAILGERPDLSGRVLTLDPEGRDIADPFGGDLEVYESCAREIEHAVAAVAEQL